MNTFLADDSELKNEHGDMVGSQSLEFAAKSPPIQNISPSVQSSPQHDLYALINGVRKGIKEIAKHNKELMSIAKLGHFKARATGADNGEIIANLTLSYRRLEDASMRLGKALQALDGGQSVYDKETTVGA